jgi:hypothetical protein
MNERLVLNIWNGKKEKNNMQVRTLYSKGLIMPKKATITVLLVPESKDVSDKQLEKDIKKSLECGWLAQVEAVKVEA